MLRPHAISTAFPYTTLFRSQERNRGEAEPFERFWRAEGVDRVVIRRLHSAAGGVPVIAHMMKREQGAAPRYRSEEHTSELQSLRHLVCRLLLEKKKKNHRRETHQHDQLTEGTDHHVHNHDNSHNSNRQKPPHQPKPPTHSRKGAGHAQAGTEMQ